MRVEWLNNMIENKKLIEEWFPIESIGEQGRKEKTGGSGGKISAIHQWHARRPTCAMRAIIMLSILSIPNSTDKLDKYKDFVIQYCNKNIPKTIKYINEEYSLINEFKVKDLINDLFKSVSDIKLLDPFAGGGSIPLESAFLGCDTYATDLNPLSLLINKATVEYPIKYFSTLQNINDYILEAAQKIYENLNKKLKKIYSNPSDEKKKISLYIWGRQIPCKNSKCNLEIPMFKSLILSKNKKWALIPEIPYDYKDKKIKFDIGWPKKENILKNFYKRGSVTCPRCNTTRSKEDVHEYFKTHEIKERLIAIYEADDKTQRFCRTATQEDYQLYKLATQIDPPVNPDLNLPNRILLWPTLAYGIGSFKEMFNKRQYLVASIISNEIIDIFDSLETKYGKEVAKVIILYLQFGLDKLIDFNSKYSMVYETGIRNTWSRPGLFMTGSYSESNPLNLKFGGTWLKYFTDLSKIFNNYMKRPYNLNGKNDLKVIQMDAQNLDFEDNYFDYIITDPPYYDSIPYASDSDFFYIWAKSSLNKIFPEFFISDSTPKQEELIAEPYIRGNMKKAKQFYENGMSKAFSECYRVLKKDGLAVIIFANKKADAWETLLNAFIESNFVISATWPVPMETKGKLAAKTSSSLTSVIIIVARKTPKLDETYFDKKLQMKFISIMEKKMDAFWKLGIRGADFFLCAIGPALSNFSKYESLLDPINDYKISVKHYMNFIQKTIVNFSIKQIMSSSYSGELDKITQFYIIWRWGYGNNYLPFDEVKKLYQAFTINLEILEKNILKKVKNKADFECLSPTERFRMFDDKQISIYQPEFLIDYLQFSCFLWERDDKHILENIINQALLKFQNIFWLISQSLHDILPKCEETTQLQGLLQRYRRFVPKKEIKIKKKKATQRKLNI